jgi:RNase H-fold protein (predicted Holliday junction resolvase)
VKRYAEALAQSVAIPLEYFDESYSTVDAQTYLAASGQKRIGIDAAAAAVILQNYLDTQHKATTNRGQTSQMGETHGE